MSTADRWSIALVVIGCCVLNAGASQRPSLAADEKRPAQPAKATDVPGPASTGQQLFAGKVVFVRDALRRRKVEAREDLDKQVALETPQGELIPIVPDWRGKAFFQDERLRDRDVELVGKRQNGIPYLQVLMIFAFDEHKRREYVDYYCDTCGFPMYEIKPCDCCQGPLRLRFQRRDLPDYIKPQNRPPGAETAPNVTRSSNAAGAP